MNTMQRNGLSQMASDQIKKYIRDRHLKPGDRLPTEREFAEGMKVSRTVVREGLNQLETIGMISKIQGKGIYLNEPNLSTFFQLVVAEWSSTAKSRAQLIEFRIFLETAALEHVLAHAQSTDYDRLDHMIHQSRHTTITRESFIQMDYEFHAQLLQLTNNEMFCQLVNYIQEYFKLIQLETDEPFNRELLLETTVYEHEALIRMLRSRKLDEAKALLHKHLTPLGQRESE